MKTTLIILLLLSTFSIPAACQSADEVTVKVLTFNILHGRTMNGDFNLDVIAQVIKNADADLVALQEVDFKTNRAQGYDLATELGARTGMASIFGKAMEYDGGEYGEAILSKHTFFSTRNVALPHSEGNEPRAALEVIVALPSGDTIAFVGTHLDHLKDDADRISQANRINQVFRKNKYPTILAGDLNDIPGSRTINIFEQLWLPSYDPSNPNPTFPSDNPEKKIDYVMVYPQRTWKVSHTQVIQDSVASDHCGYLVTLQLITSKE